MGFQPIAKGGFKPPCFQFNKVELGIKIQNIRTSLNHPSNLMSQHSPTK